METYKVSNDTEALSELGLLLARGITNINDPEIRNSAFYKVTQTIKFLHIQCEDYKVSAEMLLLIVQIVAVSPTIRSVLITTHDLPSDVDYNTPAVAAALIQSPTIHTVNMQGNFAHEEVTAQVFADHAVECFRAQIMLENCIEVNLIGMPRPLIELIVLYAVNAPITYRINEYGHYYTGLSSNNWNDSANAGPDNGFSSDDDSSSSSSSYKSVLKEGESSEIVQAPGDLLTFLHRAISDIAPIAAASAAPMLGRSFASSDKLSEEFKESDDSIA